MSEIEHAIYTLNRELNTRYYDASHGDESSRWYAMLGKLDTVASNLGYAIESNGSVSRHKSAI